MSAKRKLLATVITPALMAGAFAVLGPAATASAATCSGSSCTGKDPQSTGCGADATTLDHEDGYPGTWAELRYSATCHAAWVRVYSDAPNGNGIGATVYGENWSSTLQDYVIRCSYGTSINSNGTVWSSMCGGYAVDEMSYRV